MSIVTPELMTSANHGLKKIALNPLCRAMFSESRDFDTVFWPAAQRYILGRDFNETLPKLVTLADKGYITGLEIVGEENNAPETVAEFVQGYLDVIDQVVPEAGSPFQIGFDLTAIGLLESHALAIQNTRKILDKAKQKGVLVILSMERSELVDDIYAVFNELAPHYDNLGVTVQAHLHRTLDDLPQLIRAGRKVRLVKGVYRESEDVALPRGRALDERYLQLLSDLIDANVPVSCATHDESIVNAAHANGLLNQCLELEMLHGVQPQLLKSIKAQGVPCRITGVFGENWFLHVVHRIAEYPINMFEFLADVNDHQRVVFAQDY